MKFAQRQLEDHQYFEIEDDTFTFSEATQMIDFLADVYYQGGDMIVLRRSHLPVAFYDLTTGFAGEVLQKFSNFRMKLVVVGDFSDINSVSFKAFMHESKRNKHALFIPELIANEICQWIN